jgi:hypothetical protein
LTLDFKNATLLKKQVFNPGGSYFEDINLPAFNARQVAVIIFKTGLLQAAVIHSYTKAMERIKKWLEPQR